MAVLVDTSVWSLALRRDAPQGHPEVDVLRRALVGGDDVVGIGLILLELLRGSVPERTQRAIQLTFDRLTFVEPTRDDYAAAAAISKECRAAGVQLGTVGRTDRPGVHHARPRPADHGLRLPARERAHPSAGLVVMTGICIT